MENLKILEFYSALKAYLSQAELPIGTIIFILKSLVNELEPLFYEAAQREQDNIKKGEQKAKDQLDELLTIQNEEEQSGQE